MLDFRQYIEHSEKYLLLAEEGAKKSQDILWLLVPATILSWSAMEAFVNNMLDDFGSLPEDMFALHERAFLLERQIRFEDGGDKAGQFLLEGTEYKPLEDKILFLIAKFGKRKVSNVKVDQLWQNFQEFKNTRDALIHPRRNRQVDLDISKTKRLIQTAKDVIQLVSENVWKKKIEF